MSKVCSAYYTVDLPQEEAARGRRTAAKKAQASARTESTRSSRPTETSTSEGRDSQTNVQQKKAQKSQKERIFNPNFYKLHALGHYPDAIREYGTTDSYSTQLVCHFSLFNFVSHLKFLYKGRDEP